MNNLAPTEHHPDGPSNWPAWAECPCFDGEKDIEDADVEALIPESKKADDNAKNRGTAQHAAQAKALTGQPDAFAGLTEEEEEQVRWVVHETVEGAAGAGYAPEEIKVEQRLTMLNDDFSVLYFGTGDIDYGPFLEDAKYGDIRNYFEQVCGYALAKMDRDGYSRIYARLRYGRARKTVYHIIDRPVAERVAYSILTKRHNPNRQPKACSYCDWCKHKAVCPAVNAKVNIVLDKREDWAVRLPTMHVSQANSDPVLLGAMRWLWKAYVEPWGEGVEYATNAMASCGNVPLGFRKQDEKGRLQIDDGEGPLLALMKAGMLPEHFHENLSYSMPALAKAYVANFGGSESTAKRKIEEILVTAGVARRGEATFKLMRKPEAEDDIRSALARPVLPLRDAEQATNLNSEQEKETPTT